MEHHGPTKNVARADQRSVLSFFFDDFLHVLQVLGTRWAQIETLSSVPAVESWEKLNKTWSIIAISINNEQWQHVSNLLLVVSSNFWLLDDFDASQKPLFVVRIVKGIGMNDRIEIWSWWLGVWVPQCHFAPSKNAVWPTWSYSSPGICYHLFKGWKVLVQCMSIFQGTNNTWVLYTDCWS